MHWVKYAPSSALILSVSWLPACPMHSCTKQLQCKLLSKRLPVSIISLLRLRFKDPSTRCESLSEERKSNPSCFLSWSPAALNRLLCRRCQRPKSSCTALLSSLLPTLTPRASESQAGDGKEQRAAVDASPPPAPFWNQSSSSSQGLSPVHCPRTLPWPGHLDSAQLGNLTGNGQGPSPFSTLPLWLMVVAGYKTSRFHPPPGSWALGGNGHALSKAWGSTLLSTTTAPLVSYTASSQTPLW